MTDVQLQTATRLLFPVTASHLSDPGGCFERELCEPAERCRVLLFQLNPTQRPAFIKSGASFVRSVGAFTQYRTHTHNLGEKYCRI